MVPSTAIGTWVVMMVCTLVETVGSMGCGVCLKKHSSVDAGTCIVFYYIEQIYRQVIFHLKFALISMKALGSIIEKSAE